MGKWRWQDYLDVLLGASIAVSPWIFGMMESHPVAAGNAVILGLAIAVIAAIDLEILSRIEEWVVVALGAWAIASPWVFDFAALRGAKIAMVVAGVAVIVLTLWEIASGAGWFRSHDPAHG